MHYFIGFVIGVVVGACVSYAFRAKEHAAIAALGADVVQLRLDVHTFLGKVGAKL